MSAPGDKVADTNSLSSKLELLERPVVFTNGCFDILHRGHVAYLQRAAMLGNSLIVGVNTDDSVQRLSKGPGRPVNSVDDRLAVLAALESVDLVIAFDEDTPLELIRKIKPDHLVKGGDWAPHKIVGADFVRSYGGAVHTIPFEFDQSTSALIRRIRSTC